ncbi:NUDIX hydrolase [Streptodolium elevatio]|uniref:NUDIX domain-containing protein n=1 Tax=Streptodolium elevatio TaxID=3157996 RepID=A0ABV3DI49_9ACTN
MEVVDEWTGGLAGALQAALRMSNDAFAAHLGVAIRTVATWHEKPGLVPRTEAQQILDAALERASPTARTRFFRAIEGPTGAAPALPTEAQALTIAIAVVLKEHQVLIVCRRGNDAGGITWQFPAGVVKPGGDSASVAVRETLAETGVHCAVTQSLGQRLHPVTRVLAVYHLCEYLAGDVENRDMVENVDVMWVPRDQVTKFLPRDRIYPPVLEALEGQDDPDQR